jgi:single-strand DNA-binding protein
MSIMAYYRSQFRSRSLGGAGRGGRLPAAEGGGQLRRRACDMRETPVTVVGTLVSDMRPRRVGPDGTLVLNFRVACTERRFDKASDSWMDGDSLYLSVNCWRRLAENAASLVKGDPVIVSGKLRTREWTTDQGERRSVVELEANAVGPDLARCAATVRKQRREEPPRAGDDDATASPEENPADLLARADQPYRVSLSDLAEAARPLVPAPV